MTLESLLNGGLGIFICLGVSVFMWAFVAATFRWTTGPMLQGDSESKRTTTFQLTDLICLVLQIQLAMVVVSSAFPWEMPADLRATAIVLFSLPVVIFWLASLLVVSRAGIRRPFRRAAVFLILMPGVAVTILGMPLLVIGLLQALAETRGGGTPVASPLVVASQIAMLMLFSQGLRWLAHWAVAPERPREPVNRSAPVKT